MGSSSQLLAAASLLDGWHVSLGLMQGSLWLSADLSTTVGGGGAQNASAAAGLIQAAAQDPAVLAAAQKLVDVVKTAALTAGLDVKALAADPNVQAAIVPVLEAVAAASPVNWASVDTTALIAKVGLLFTVSLLQCATCLVWLGHQLGLRALRSLCFQCLPLQDGRR